MVLPSNQTLTFGMFWSTQLVIYSHHLTQCFEYFCRDLKWVPLSELADVGSPKEKIQWFITNVAAVRAWSMIILAWENITYLDNTAWTWSIYLNGWLIAAGNGPMKSNWRCSYELMFRHVRKVCFLIWDNIWVGRVFVCTTYLTFFDKFLNIWFHPFPIEGIPHLPPGSVYACPCALQGSTEGRFLAEAEERHD